MAEEDGDKKEAAKEKKSPLMLIIIIAVLLVVVGGAAAAYFLVLKPKDDAGGQEAPQAVAVQQQAPQAAPDGEGGAMGPVVQMEPFIVNLTDAQGTRYLKVSVQLELSNQKLGDEITQRTPLIRDEVIMILSSKSFEDVSTIAGKRALKRSMINGINKYLRTGQVTRVYFTDFVVQ